VEDIGTYQKQVHPKLLKSASAFAFNPDQVARSGGQIRWPDQVARLGGEMGRPDWAEEVERRWRGNAGDQRALNPAAAVPGNNVAGALHPLIYIAHYI
jgi:hypothetical protein